MTTRFTALNLQAVFTFPFQDEKWKSKFAIALFIAFASILIIPGFFLGGYYYELMKRIIVDKEDPSLPDWNDTGRYFKNGLKLFGVGLVYSIPSLLFLLPTFIFFLPAIYSDTMSAELSVLFLAALPIVMGLFFLGSLVGISMSLFSTIGIAHMIANDGDIRAAFRIKQWWPIFRNNMGGYLLTYIIIMGASWILSFFYQFLMLTIVLCVLVPFFMVAVSFYLGMIRFVLFSQAYLDGLEKSIQPGLPPNPA